MLNLHFRSIAALALATLAGCASRGSDWPSLMTPDEQRTGKPSTTAVETPVAPPAPAPSPAPVVEESATAAVRAQTSRLAEARRDTSYIAERFGKQQELLTSVVAGIKTRGPSDSLWNKAQMELTKLNQIAAEWDDLETVVNQVAGQLAISAHQGVTVAAPLADAGALLAQIDTARANAVKVRDALRRKISQ